MRMIVQSEHGVLLDQVFTIGVGLKGLDGALEIIGGLLLIFLSPERLNAIVRFLTQYELSEDPKDFIATHLLAYVHSLTTAVTLFLAFYLLAHGIVKIVLVVAVLQKRLWAYPWMIGFLLVFIAYQLYQLALQLSAGLLVLTAFDGFVVWLTVLEYKKYAGGRQT